MNSVRNCP